MDGENAIITEFPWQVGLLKLYKKDGKYGIIHCGGTLLDSKTVLTAGHCYKSDYDQIKVVVGETFIINEKKKNYNSEGGKYDFNS